MNPVQTSRSGIGPVNTEHVRNKLHRRRITVCFIAAGLLLTGLSKAASAATLSSQTNVASFDQNDQQLHSICFSFSASGAQTQCQNSYGLPGSNLSYQASAFADYGVLKVYGASSIARPDAPSGTSGPSYTSATGSANFRDQWTITGKPDGTTGTLQLGFSITGSYDFHQIGAGVTTGFSLITFGASNHYYAPSPAFNLSGSAGNLAYSGVFSVPFTYGTPLDFMVNLTGGSNLHNLQGGGYNGQSSFMDLSHTARMNAIIAKDGNGNAVPFSLSTASGGTLFNELAPVPLPAGLPLLLAGVAGLLSLGRRKQI